MNELTEDDYYEIEKICDVYAGWISENLVRACDVALKVDATTKDDTKENPLNFQIIQLQKAQKRVKEIREKLEERRKTDYSEE